MLLGVTSADAGTAGHKPLELRVTPHTCQAPCSIRIIVRVEPDPANRYVALVLDGPNFATSSVIPLNGDQSPPTQDAKWFKDIPKGEYSLDGYLQASTGIVAHESAQIIVSGGLYD